MSFISHPIFAMPSTGPIFLSSVMLFSFFLPRHAITARDDLRMMSALVEAPVMFNIERII